MRKIDIRLRAAQGMAQCGMFSRIWGASGGQEGDGSMRHGGCQRVTRA